MLLKMSFIQTMLLLKITFAPVCEDVIITPSNVYKDFNIYKVKSVGHIKLSDNFRNVLKHKKKTIILNGYVIHRNIESYILNQLSPFINIIIFQRYLSTLINSYEPEESMLIDCDSLCF